MNGITRRQFIKIGLLSGVAFGTTLPIRSFAQSKASSKKTLVNQIDSQFDPDIEIQLTASRRQVSIFRDRMTDVWSYQGKILKGDSFHLTENPNTYLGPTIKVKKGEKVRIFFTNDIPDISIIHWHGLHVPEQADGHPRYVIPQGATYVYEFEVKNRAGTYLYHPHPHGITGQQVYYGLAGLFLVEDEEEKSLRLPSGEFDVPLVIQDRQFNADGSLRYLSGSMMERMQGFLGDVMLVNGQPDYTLPVKTTMYRMRLLNVSNSRIYKLYLSNGADFIVIGTDGGLLPAPVKRPYLVLGPAERVEILVDFSTYQKGDTIQLRSMPFEGGSMGMGMMGGGGMMGMMGRGGMIGSSGLTNGGEDLKIAEFQVASHIQRSTKIPEQLSVISSPAAREAINYANPRRFYFEMRMMTPTINGRTFEMETVASDEVVKLNTTELWEVINAGGNMTMPHPVHIHGLQFRVIEREGTPRELKDGYVDTGWKDTVLLMPGEAARLLLRFEDFTGLYLYHCHNLEHEDLGMMRNYRVV